MSAVVMGFIAFGAFWLGLFIGFILVPTPGEEARNLYDEVMELANENKRLNFQLAQAKQKIAAYKFLVTPPSTGPSDP